MNAIDELRNIANAKRENFEDAEEFRTWAQNRARHALEAVPAPLAPEVAEAVRNLSDECESRDRHVPGSYTVTIERSALDTLLRAVRSGGLTEEVGE